MKFVPSNTIIVILVIIAFFAAGMLAGKMFSGKKKEKFEDDSYMGEFNTPRAMADGPKVLPKVPENVGVVSGETWCKAANC